MRRPRCLLCGSRTWCGACVSCTGVVTDTRDCDGGVYGGGAGAPTDSTTVNTATLQLLVLSNFFVLVEEVLAAGTAVVVGARRAGQGLEEGRAPHLGDLLLRKWLAHATVDHLTPAYPILHRSRSPMVNTCPLPNTIAHRAPTTQLQVSRPLWRQDPFGAALYLPYIVY